MLDNIFRNAIFKIWNTFIQNKSVKKFMSDNNMKKRLSYSTKTELLMYVHLKNPRGLFVPKH